MASESPARPSTSGSTPTSTSIQAPMPPPSAGVPPGALPPHPPGMRPAPNASASASASASTSRTANNARANTRPSSGARPGPSAAGKNKATRAPQPPPPPPSSRTLKQPMTLRVAEAAPGSGRGVAGEGAGAGDKAELRRAFERRAQAARRAERWADRAMEEVLPRDVFLQALTYMHRATYLEVQHERHLNSLCAYPPCPHAPAAPYRSRKRFVVSTAARTITERDGNDDQAFCSRKCAARGAYVLEQLGTEAPWLGGGGGGLGEKVTLLEDLEARGDVRWGGARGQTLVWVRKEEEERKRREEEERGKMEEEKKAEEAKKETGLGALLAGLSIVERATPAAKPTPPTLDAPRLPVEPGAPVAIRCGADAEVAGLPLPLPGGEVQVPLLRRASQAADAGGSGGPGGGGAKASGGKGRRGGSSLLSTEHAGLANSVLDAARRIGPGVDEESEESEEEEEWAKAMGWGSGPEVDALFAVAAEARRLAEGEGEGEGEGAETAAAESAGKTEPPQAP